MNRYSIFYFIFILVIMFLVFQMIGITLWVIRGIIFLAIRYWYVVMAIILLYYIVKKVNRPKTKHHQEDDNIIEIKDYEIK